MALLTTSAFAVEFNLENATVTRTQLNNNYYGGGCLVYVPEFVNMGIHCADNWVTFDCDPSKNADNTKRAELMHTYALIAFEKDRKINLIVNQARRIDKHCTVTSIELLK